MHDPAGGQRGCVEEGQLDRSVPCLLSFLDLLLPVLKRLCWSLYAGLFNRPGLKRFCRCAGPAAAAPRTLCVDKEMSQLQQVDRGRERCSLRSGYGNCSPVKVSPREALSCGYPTPVRKHGRHSPLEGPSLGALELPGVIFCTFFDAGDGCGDARNPSPVTFRLVGALRLPLPAWREGCMGRGVSRCMHEAREVRQRHMTPTHLPETVEGGLRAEQPARLPAELRQAQHSTPRAKALPQQRQNQSRLVMGARHRLCDSKGERSISRGRSTCTR
jgi:hypothetical protein